MAVRDVVVEDNDLGLKAIEKEIKKLDGTHTDIGQFGSGGDPSEDIAARAAVQEFGTRDGRVPSRPFQRDTFKKNLKDLKIEIEKGYNMLLERRSNVKKLLEDIGEWYTGKMKEIFTEGTFKALAEATVRQKKSSRPLVDKGDMRRMTTHKEKI